MNIEPRPASLPPRFTSWMTPITCCASTAPRRRQRSARPLAIGGLAAGEQIEGIDFRPATGELYAPGIVETAGDDEGRLYKIDLATAAATLVGTGPFSTAIPAGLRYGSNAMVAHFAFHIPRGDTGAPGR